MELGSSMCQLLGRRTKKPNVRIWGAKLPTALGFMGSETSFRGHYGITPRGVSVYTAYTQPMAQSPLDVSLCLETAVFRGV